MPAPIIIGWESSTKALTYNITTGDILWLAIIRREINGSRKVPFMDFYDTME